MENCCIIYFGGDKICDVTNLGGAIALLCIPELNLFCKIRHNQIFNQHIEQQHFGLDTLSKVRAH